MSTTTTRTARTARSTKKVAEQTPVVEPVVEQPAEVEGETAEAKTLRYGYLADKEIAANHVAAAAWMSEHTGLEIDAKTLQVFAALYPAWQRSDENQALLADKRTAAQRKAEERAKAKEAKERAEFERLQAKFAADKA